MTIENKVLLSCTGAMTSRPQQAASQSLSLTSPCRASLPPPATLPSAIWLLTLSSSQALRVMFRCVSWPSSCEVLCEHQASGTCTCACCHIMTASATIVSAQAGLYVTPMMLAILLQCQATL